MTNFGIKKGRNKRYEIRFFPIQYYDLQLESNTSGTFKNDQISNFTKGDKKSL